MQTITLTPGDIPAANPALLREELVAALGLPVQVLVRQTSGLLTEAVVARTDGQAFSGEEYALVLTTAHDHDPALLSTRQAQAEALELRRSEARERLITLGADAVRVTGLPDLAAVVADIVEALALDID